VETLGMGQAPKGDRLAILTNGGGIGVMAVDALLDRGGRLAPRGDETLRALDAFLPRTWSHGNPVDILGDAPGERYAKALEILLKEPNADAILVLKCPTAVASSEDAARAVIDTSAQAGAACSPAGSARTPRSRPGSCSASTASRPTSRRNGRCAPSSTC
jgi:acetyltransferase